MTRYVVDASVILQVLEEEAELPDRHELLAPTLVRSQVLNELFRSVKSGEIPESVGLDRLGRFAGMKIRYLGDKVLRRQAWKVANRLGSNSTNDAEYIALTQLQADAFVTMSDELRRMADEIVETTSLDSLR